MGRILSGSDQLLSRRRIFKGIAGAAAVGAGAVVLVESASPASAAPTETTIESGAVAPAVVDLADAATIAVDASVGNDFRLTIGGDRTMGTPANPADGQRIVFQVTQGSGGSFALSWSGGYEFSLGLPEPTLSTTAGQTDLVSFIYNATKAKWLCATFVKGFAGAPATTPPPGTYRLFSVNGPSTAVSYSGPFVSGVVFGVTGGGCWLDGYWWWVCASGQPTAAQEFALWCMYSSPDHGSLVPNSTITSGALTAGRWNYVGLPAPIPLAIGATYVATTGFTGGFPDTNNQFGSGDVYGNGIVSGPLTGYSNSSGSRPSPFNTGQGVFSVSSADPTSTMPVYGSGADNFWMDVSVDTNPSAGTSYRLWPGYPTLPGTATSDVTSYTLGTEFQLAEACVLDNIWFYSPSGVGVLPITCGIWDVSTQSVVAGTVNMSPAWSGGAGSGWVACAYNGVTLPAGDYKVAVFNTGGSQWFQVTVNYWSSSGTGANGITAGPLTAPGISSATTPGQGTYNTGSWAYPDTFSTGGNGENYWLDVEVTPTSLMEIAIGATVQKDGGTPWAGNPQFVGASPARSRHRAGEASSRAVSRWRPWAWARARWQRQAPAPLRRTPPSSRERSRRRW